MLWYTATQYLVDKQHSYVFLCKLLFHTEFKWLSHASKKLAEKQKIGLTRYSQVSWRQCLFVMLNRYCRKRVFIHFTTGSDYIQEIRTNVIFIDMKPLSKNEMPAGVTCVLLRIQNEILIQFSYSPHGGVYPAALQDFHLLFSCWCPVGYNFLRNVCTMQTRVCY